MARARLKIKGSLKVIRNLDGVKRVGVKALGAGLYRLGNDIMTDAKSRTPVDLGALKGSGYVTLPEKRRRQIVVEDGFGGPAKDYAIVQHEDLTLSHTVGEAKFLENAFNAARPHAGRTLQRFVAEAIKRGSASTPSGDHQQRPG